MSYTQSTTTKSPFTTSTAYNSRGATAFNEDWVTVTGTAPPVATISGVGIGMGCHVSSSSGSDRIYFANSDYEDLSGHTYYSNYQLFATSQDEYISISSSSFTTVSHRGASSGDTSTSRTNIFKIGY